MFGLHVHIVAITSLADASDVDLESLSRELALTPYETRLLLASGTPAVIQRTPNKHNALDLAARLRVRGHGAVACDAATLVSSRAMISMHGFCLEDDAVSLDTEPEQRLPYDAILAFVHGKWRQSQESSKVTIDPAFSAARAVAFFNSYAPLVRYTVTRETRATLDEREQVLYVFPFTGTPWLLREHGTNWRGLGTLMGLSESANFQITLAALRERAPKAIYDERLLHLKGLPERVISLGSATSTTSTEEGVTLLAQVVALSLASEPTPGSEGHPRWA